MLPTIALLPFAKQSAPPLVLTHETVPLRNTQTRLAGRTALVPVVELDSYRFQVVIDWIEIQIHFNRMTQAQHVQQVLRLFLNRDSYILADKEYAGRTFDTCTIKVQEPKNLAQIVQIHRALVDRFGETTKSRVTGIEVSVDAYPIQPSDTARMTLLGALQRTVWTGRNIWWHPDGRPRSVSGKSKRDAYKLSPEPELEARVNKAGNNGERVSRLVPHHHQFPAIDGTMYLGSKDDDVMIRVMDKIIDSQRPDGAFNILHNGQKRVRIEVTVKGSELTEIGVQDIPSLQTLKLTAFQKRYFQFRLPTFSYRADPKTGADAIHNTKQIWRAETYLRSGITGLMSMDAATDEHLATKKKCVQKTLRNMNMNKARTFAGTRLATSFLSWERLHRIVHVAFGNLEKREASAWKRLMKAETGK